MEMFGFFVAAGAVASAFFIVRKLIQEFSGPSRSERYREMYRELEKADKKITGKNTPRCPLCGSDTERYEYPHIRVWRCVRYPECRGFVKAGRGGARYARQWRQR